MIAGFLDKGRKNRYARVLLAVLLAVIIASGFFIVTHVQHDHPGPGCHTCTEITVCGLILEGVGIAALLLLITSRARGAAPEGRRAGIYRGHSAFAGILFFRGRARMNC
jgi:hypothetical protein